MIDIQIPIEYLTHNSPYYCQGIGTMRSPLLKDLHNGLTDNLQTFYFAKAIINGTAETVKNIIAQSSGLMPDTLNGLDKFNLITYSEIGIELFGKILSLFFINRIAYQESEKAFILLQADETKPDTLEGFVNAETFDLYCSLMSQLMHDTKSEEKKEEDLSGKPPEVLKALETFNKYANKTKSENYKDYTIPNIISKMCTASMGYNLLNIYDLTIWQLYDQFQSYAQNRIAHISERSFTIWGGDNFDFNLWLKNTNDS